MRRILAFAVIVLTALVIGCGSSQPAAPAASAPVASAPAGPLFAPHGFDLTAMDPSVKACDDFYRFAVGKWRDSHPLPPQYSRYGRFEELADRNRDVLHTILEEDAAKTNAAAGSAEQKIGDFYASCMNEAAVEAARLRLRPILMTSFAFILGVAPLVLATGAGANARKSIGITVFSGMLASTCLAVLLVPTFFVVVQRFENWLAERKARKAAGAPQVS